MTAVYDLIRERRFAEALEAVEPLLEGSSRPTALRLKMRTLMQVDLVRSEDVIRQIIAECGEDAETRTNLASSLWAQGRRLEALAEARAAVALDPKRSGSRRRLISLLNSLERRQDAMDILAEGLALSPDDAVLLRLKEQAEGRKTPPKVLEGLDGWLYLDHDANRSVDQYTGRLTLAASAATAWRTHFERIAELRAELGFRFVQVFAPSKESVYEAFYPHRDKRAAKRPIDEVIGLAQAGLPIVYPTKELAPRTGRLDTYDKGDTHWNEFGAAVAADIVVRTVGREMPPLPGFSIRTEQGDLVEMDGGGGRSRSRSTANCGTAGASWLWSTRPRRRGPPSCSATRSAAFSASR